MLFLGVPRLSDQIVMLKRRRLANSLPKKHSDQLIDLAMNSITSNRGGSPQANSNTMPDGTTFSNRNLIAPSK